MSEPLRYSAAELEGARVEGMHEAAERICDHCRREGPPKPNENGVPVHRTFSSRGLGSDHECRAQEIHDLIAEHEKEHTQPQPKEG